MTAAARPCRARPASTPRPVVIDTDPGIDDALALMLALRSPELRVELITTVAGNVPIPMATANARRVLALLAPPVWPVVAQGLGRPLRRPLYTATAFHSDDGLGGVTHLRHAGRQPVLSCPGAASNTSAGSAASAAGGAALWSRLDDHCPGTAHEYRACHPMCPCTHAAAWSPRDHGWSDWRARQCQSCRRV